MTVRKVKTVAELLERYATGERDFQGIDLEGRINRDVSLEGTDLRGINLANGNLAECPLNHINFSGANLQGVWFQSSSLRRCNFL
ncbi:MAG: pentapeptide repeat-containing protein [Rivularia sp. (in: cyanobacteria)]